MTTPTDEPRILIVDDEELARIRLKRYFTANHPTYVLAEAADGVEALAMIAEFAPSIVFLDIEMPELSGFEVLMQLEARPFAIIFQTAYSEFAVKAFEENACDYLLKPFSDERLAVALKKARSSTPNLPGLEKALTQGRVHMKKLVIRAGNRQRIIDQDDILCFISESHATRVFLHDIDFVYDHSLSFLEERLDPQVFLRIHRNAIVNLAAIKSMNLTLKSTVTLANGKELAVSRERKRDLKAALSRL